MEDGRLREGQLYPYAVLADGTDFEKMIEAAIEAGCFDLPGIILSTMECSVRSSHIDQRKIILCCSLAKIMEEAPEYSLKECISFMKTQVFYVKYNS